MTEGSAIERAIVAALLDDSQGDPVQAFNGDIPGDDANSDDQPWVSFLANHRPALKDKDGNVFRVLATVTFTVLSNTAAEMDDIAGRVRARMENLGTGMRSFLTDDQLTRAGQLFKSTLVYTVEHLPSLGELVTD